MKEQLTPDCSRQSPECAAYPQSTEREQDYFVIANPEGVKQSSATVDKIASSGKERPLRNDSLGLPCSRWSPRS